MGARNINSKYQTDTLKTETNFSYETSVITKLTRNHTPGDKVLHYKWSKKQIMKAVFFK
jgi:hypothetical protein